MVHYVLLLAVLKGGEWHVQPSDFIFRKQEVCQLVGEKLKRKHEIVKHYRCVERTEV